MLSYPLLVNDVSWQCGSMQCEIFGQKSENSVVTFKLLMGVVENIDQGTLDGILIHW